jgi:hypothetical protein
MTLDDYLTETGISNAAFAASIHREPSTVGRLRRGLTMPDWETMSVIKNATDGAVGADDFLREYEVRKAKAVA